MSIATGVDDEDDKDRWLWENRISKYFNEPRKPEDTGDSRPPEKDPSIRQSRDLKAYAFFSAQATRSKRLTFVGGLAFIAFTFIAISFPIGSLSFFGLLALAVVGWGTLFCGILRWKLYGSLVRLGQKLELHLQKAIK